ncbi:MAG: S46 family peptidase, partial [Candidatus Eisenbacteria bacterium]
MMPFLSGRTPVVRILCLALTGRSSLSHAPRLVLNSVFLSVLLVGLAAPRARPDEGMWLPHDLPDAVVERMHAEGCELTKDEIFNSLGTGAANAVVKLGATGCFVSSEGLILTNHHVAFRAAQRMSTPERNYIERGFLARTREEEAPAIGYQAYVLQSVEDVTGEVL